MPWFLFCARAGSGRPGPVLACWQRLLRTTRAGARALLPLAACFWLTAAAAVTVNGSGVVVVRPTPPSIPSVNLGAPGFFSAPTIDKPALTLVLSIEYPTAGALYTPGGNTDDSYTSDREYHGYYDNNACYAYIDNPDDEIAPGYTKADYKRFKKVGPANGRQCIANFSGNFLNWASSSVLDMLRLALTGGDRYVDTPNLTILQRAVLPSKLWYDKNDQVPTCMWNSDYFPAKVLKGRGGGFKNYWGAIPNHMRDVANNQDIYIANKWNRIYFGTERGGDCHDSTKYKLGSADELPKLPNKIYNSDGFFFARVQVCDGDPGNRNDARVDTRAFCQLYPNNKYKPIGAIQKYGEQIRLAAFGYLMDQSNRYGGVLRVPMKYTGRKTYDINGRENTPPEGNPNAEWDANTGVFHPDPDNVTAAGKWTTSGIINYVNKLGRTGRFGMYKENDTLSEMYYEALRYLQGMTPVAGAIAGAENGANLTLADGFPYYASWSGLDPYGGGRTAAGDYSCVKSNILVIGDVHTTDNFVTRIPGTDVANNVDSIKQEFGVVADFEFKRSAGYQDENGIDHPALNPNDTINKHLDRLYMKAEDEHAIIGIAWDARFRDIRSKRWTNRPDLQRRGLRVKTMTFDVNEGGRQNNPDTRRLTNQLFTAAKYGGYESDPANPGGNSYNTWGNPYMKDSGEKDNDVWQRKPDPKRKIEAGEAASYYFYDRSENKISEAVPAVLDSFKEIFRSGVGLRPQAAGSSSSQKMGNQIAWDSTLYRAKFNTEDWSGDIVATPVSNNASAGHSLTALPDRWSAAQLLDRMTPSERKIFVGKVDRSGTQRATPFLWNSLENSLREQLDRPAPDLASDSRSAIRTLFLRGNRSYDGDPFRTRKSLLGDIINSNISYSGLPRRRFEGLAYDAFYQRYTGRNARRPAIFAGANDGMLHAFDAASGSELFAYIPSWMGPKLSALTAVGYTGQHQSYVDGPSVVSEARTGATDTRAEDWKTVLVSGTGAGGSGVFALDVTDPTNFDENHVLWEFTRADDANIGQVVGAPKILKIKTPNASATAAAAAAAQYRWFAAVASGVNNYVRDSASGRFSETGQPALFLLALDKAPTDSWKEGTNYYRISIPVDSSLSTSQATGLLNFSALYGSAGEMTDLYFGDLHGQVWRLQFSGKPTTDWSNINKLSFFKRADGTARPLFLARSGETPAKVQPISAAPTLFVGPRLSGRETFYLLFGTGKYLEPADNASTSQQSLYALLDNGDPAASTSGDGAAVIGSRLQLQAASLDKENKKITVAPFVWGYPTTATASTPRAGWYFDLPETGERIDQAGQDLGALTLAINSKIPGATASAASTTCAASTSPGGGNEYLLNVNTGAANYSASSVGLLGAPLMLSNRAETVVGAADSAGRRLSTATYRRWSTGQDASQATDNANQFTGKAKPAQITGRLSWRQIANYQELRRAPAAGASAGTGH